MEKDITKKYVKDDLTILWRPKKCIHAAVCVKMLPDVYNPQDRPWLKPENATIAQLKEQIDACPSGALGWEMVGETKTGQEAEGVKATVRENGPLLVKGQMEVTGIDGKTEMKSGMTAICRCGASQNKPYCDGAHAKINFKG